MKSGVGIPPADVVSAWSLWPRLSLLLTRRVPWASPCPRHRPGQRAQRFLVEDLAGVAGGFIAGELREQPVIDDLNFWHLRHPPVKSAPDADRQRRVYALSIGGQLCAMRLITVKYGGHCAYHLQ